MIAKLNTESLYVVHINKTVTFEAIFFTKVKSFATLLDKNNL